MGAIVSQSRRPMRRIGDMLPEAAAALGIEPALRRARAAAAWERTVGERVPAATGGSNLVEWREGVGLLVVGATQSIIAQELRMRSDELLEAFGRAMGGTKPERLEVVVRSRRQAD
jgi:hypothetical protein